MTMAWGNDSAADDPLVTVGPQSEEWDDVSDEGEGVVGAGQRTQGYNNTRPDTNAGPTRGPRGNVVADSPSPQDIACFVADDTENAA